MEKIKSEVVETLSGSFYRTTVDDIIIYENSITEFPAEMLHALMDYDEMVKPGVTTLLVNIWVEPARHIVGGEIVTTYDLWGRLQDVFDESDNYRSVLLARDIAATGALASILCSAFADATNVIEGRYRNDNS